VNRTLRDLLDAGNGILRRPDVLINVDHDVLDQALLSGQLVRVFPETYVRPSLVNDRAAMVDAALAYANGHAALSHLSALAAWRLPVPPGGPIHLITDSTHRLRGVPGLKVHRRDGLELIPPTVVSRGGWPTTRLEQSIIDSWPLLDGDASRAPAIYAVSQRMTTPGRLREALQTAPRLAGRRLFVRMIRLLAGGCRSNLEIWGYDQVFRGGEFDRLRWQVPVRVGQRTVYLDVFDDRTGVNFELDGAKYHADPASRERDLRRDAALAVLGITVVRFTHNRLVREPDEVAREARAILRTRGRTSGAA
jgi:very-short-patch-repair endonuclease